MKNVSLLLSLWNSVRDPAGLSKTLRGQRHAVEWPTVALAVVIYGGWLALTWFHAGLPWPILMVLGAWICAWHSSLQHEVLHGHPTHHPRINFAIGTPPLSLWLPFEAYRISHLVHHRDERLTDPLDDPESWYWTPELWGRLSPLGRLLISAQATLPGRMLIAPPWNIGRFLNFELTAVLNGNRARRRLWTAHMLHVAPVLVWLVLVCRMPVWFYVAVFVLPGMALLTVRSYAEHRAASGVPERTAIVENAPILGLLFLFNNLHAAHHERPGLAWYRLPRWYRANRERLIAMNGGLVYDSYVDVARRYLLRGHAPPLHPLGRATPFGRSA